MYDQRKFPAALKSRSSASFARIRMTSSARFARIRMTHMITGIHALVYSKQADAVRAFLRDVLDFPSVDAGGGWPIFALPPAEIAVHPSDAADAHELYLMCDDLD